MPDGWTLEDWIAGEIDDDVFVDPGRYVFKYEDIYVNFDSPDFIRGVHTTFEWLGVPELKGIVGNIYDTVNKIQIIVN